MSAKNNGKKGFSLAETAISLVVMGLVMSSLVPLYRVHYKAHRKLLNEEKKEKIFQAVGAFLRLHGRLPCPADPFSQGEGRGIEKKDCVDLLVDAGGEVQQTYGKSQGLVPFRTLGLPETASVNANNVRFIFVVNPHFVQKHGFDFCSYPSSDLAGPIVFDQGVRVSGGHVYSPGARSMDFSTAKKHTILKSRGADRNPVVVALINLGYSPEGDDFVLRYLQHRGSNNPVEGQRGCGFENINNDNVFCARPPREEEHTVCRDTVWWETRYAFAWKYAKIPCWVGEEIPAHDDVDDTQGADPQ